MSSIDAAAKKSREWSVQQKAIFDWCKTGQGNMVVRARAGTGKTTTILEALSYAPEKKILLAAFNKRIATELKEKLKSPNAEAKTLHSVGVSFVYRNWQGCQLDEERGERLARRSLPAGAPDAVVTLVKRLAAIGKNAAPFPQQDQMVELAYQFDIDPDEYLEEQGWTTSRIAEAAIKSMKLALQKDGAIDFDDMVYVPLANGWIIPRFDMVVIDEAQDMNASQLMLAMKVCKRGGRIMVVGDDRQAIYGFRGADSNSLDRLKGELVAAEMGLTITYRCPKNVVKIAAEIVPDYQAAPTAPDGIVSNATYEKMIELAGPGDFVLSRKNAPLMKICLKFIAQGRRAMIEGREIGAGLIAVIKKVKGKSVPDFMERLTKWETKQIERLKKANKKSALKKVDYISDQVETLMTIAAACKSVSEMESKIKDMFQETAGGKKDMIVCSSVHKAKGTETDRVFGLVETLFPGKTNSIEEQNIAYVMYTRAKREFVSVTGIS